MTKILTVIHCSFLLYSFLLLFLSYSTFILSLLFSHLFVSQLACHITQPSLLLLCRYGVGYHMVIVKEQHCVSSAIINLVTETVRGSKMATDVGAEITFVLPSSSSHQFPQLFELLEGDTSHDCTNSLHIL